MAKKEPASAVEQGSQKPKVDRPHPRHHLLQSKQFAGKKDLIFALVGEEELVTVAETQKRIQQFMKQEVT